MPFTDRQVSSLRPKAQRFEKPEPGRTGLWLRVTPKGHKSWTFRYRFNGEQKRVVFGNYPSMGVADAHIALADAREKLKRNVDPGAIIAEQRQAERNAETIEDLVEEYLERHARKTMKPATATEDERVLRREVLPDWKGHKAKDITRRDIIRLLDKIADRGAPVMRNRVAGVLSRMFRFALDRGVIDASPAVGVRRLEEQSRNRFLSVDEIRSFWHGLDGADMIPTVRIALRFLLVTGQRRAEVAGAARSEIDDAESTWRLPAVRAKNGRENLIPLPALALRIVVDADAARVRSKPVRPNRKGWPAYDPTPSPWLFPSTRFGKPLEPAALTRALNRNRAVLGVGDATVHDIRRTFATWHGEIGTQPEILAALMNHAPTTITAAVYNRASNLEPRRRAMAAWCGWLERVIAGETISENVIQMARR